jgi:hypothetical protein
LIAGQKTFSVMPFPKYFLSFNSKTDELKLSGRIFIDKYVLSFLKLLFSEGNAVRRFRCSTLQVNLAGQPCRLTLGENLAGQPCGRTLQVNLAGQPCRSTLQVNLAGQPCRTTLQVNFAGQPCR